MAIAPHSTFQWAVNRISMQQAWQVTTGSHNIRVGILGSRIDANHPQLRGRVRSDLGGIFHSDAGNPNPYTWGTQQAGIIGASGNNSISMAGIAPNIEFVPLRAVNSTGAMPNSAAIAAINHARQTGIPIITRSFGVSTSDMAFLNSVRNYTGLFINAAGNDGQNTNANPRLPGLPNVIIVGASDQNDVRRSYSNFGSTSVHVFAPSGVQTTFPNNSFGNYSGTSAATPHVAGIAALILSLNPNLTPQQVRNIILDSVDPVPGLASISGGRVNAYRAVRGTTATAGIQGFMNANVPLRSGPNANYNNLGDLTTNTAVTVLGSTPSGSWLRIRLGIGSSGQVGWVRQDRVTVR